MWIYHFLICFQSLKLPENCCEPGQTIPTTDEFDISVALTEVSSGIRGG